MSSDPLNPANQGHFAKLALRLAAAIMFCALAYVFFQQTHKMITAFGFPAAFFHGDFWIGAISCLIGMVFFGSLAISGRFMLGYTETVNRVFVAMADSK